MAIKRRVVVEQHEAVRTIARKHVSQLLHHPRGRRLAGHVEMQNLARWCSMTKKHESSWKVNVGTVKKSQAMIASRWLARKADQRMAGSPWRGPRRRYRATRRSEPSNASLKRSPWILGAPQSAFSAARRRLRRRNSS